MKSSGEHKVTIPDKKYFRIGEVAALVGVDPHVLRYWETEFAVIRPHRTRSRQRLYRVQDVENLLLIRKLLHEDGYTISGARKALRKQRQQPAQPTTSTKAKDGHLVQIKQELRAILARLQG